jgi:hypothetical protein
MDLVQVLLAGIAATACMSLCLYSIHWSGFANGDMVRALGSLVTRSYENSLLIGWLIHFTAGSLFAVLYTQAWQMTLRRGLAWLICTLFGLFHGIAVSLILVIAVAEHHPLEPFREAGFRVGVTHVAAHVVYGLVLGIAVSVFELHL